MDCSDTSSIGVTRQELNERPLDGTLRKDRVGLIAVDIRLTFRGYRIPNGAGVTSESGAHFRHLAHFFASRDESGGAYGRGSPRQSRKS